MTADKLTIKTCLLLVFINLFVLVILGDFPPIDYYHYEYYSENQKYVLEVTFANDKHEFALYTKTQQMIWRQILPHQIAALYPRVSNIGEVALPVNDREIYFIDRTGKRIGSFAPPKQKVAFLADETMWTVHQYTPDGLHYYCFTLLKSHAGPVFLNAMDNRGKQKWRIKIKRLPTKYKERESFDYWAHDIQVQNNIILIDDLSLASFNYKNCLHLIDKNEGRIIQSLIQKIPNTGNVIFKDPDEILLFSGSSVDFDLRSYKISSGKYIQLKKKEIYTLLFDQNPRYLSFAIVSLAFTKDDFLKKLPEKVITRLMDLNQRDDWRSPFIGRSKDDIVAPLLKILNIKDLFYMDKKPFNGRYYQYFIDGTPKKVEEYKNGLRDGKSIEYFRNGKKRIQATYVKGLLNGEYIQWFYNGQIKVKYQYKAGNIQ